jgi:hypothetical protein
MTMMRGACKKDVCARAIDHVGHLSWVESQKMLEKLSPATRAETVKVLPTEEMMRPKMREIIGNRFGARCHEPAFAQCVLAAEDPAAVARCEHPQ